MDESIDIVIGNNKKHELVSLLQEYEASHRKTACVADINHEKQAYEELSLSRTAEHTRAFIKVQDGCNQFCTYCIIPFARGRVRSRELPDVLQEIRTLAKKRLPRGGADRNPSEFLRVDNGETLLHLIEAVHELEGIGADSPGKLRAAHCDRCICKKTLGAAEDLPAFSPVIAERLRYGVKPHEPAVRYDGI